MGLSPISSRQKCPLYFQKPEEVDEGEEVFCCVNASSSLLLSSSSLLSRKMNKERGILCALSLFHTHTHTLTRTQSVILFAPKKKERNEEGEGEKEKSNKEAKIQAALPPLEGSAVASFI